MNIADHFTEISKIKAYLLEKYGARIRAIQVELERHAYAHRSNDRSSKQSKKDSV